MNEIANEHSTLFEQLDKQARHFYDEDDFFNTFDVLSRIEENLDAFGPEERRVFAHDAIYMSMRLHRSEMHMLMRELVNNDDDDDEWTRVSEVEGITTCYKACDSSPTHSFRVEGMVAAPLFHLIAKIFEVDLYAEWMPGVLHSTTLGSLSRFRLLLHLEFDLPWPLANRDVVLYGYGDIVENNSVCVFLRSAEREHFRMCTVPPPELSDDNVEVMVNFGGFHFVPIDETHTHVKALFNIDPKVPLLPYWMMNLVANKVCFYLIKLMREHEVNDEYKRRIATNRHVYGEIERRLGDLMLNLHTNTTT